MLLQNTKKLEKETEEFIDKFIRIALVFEEAVKSYFSGNSESFSHYIQESDKLESDVDHIRKDIELSLYSKMLIPESRGDVFKILESMDDVADQVEWLIR
ncbi:MAG: DUF47 family protein, partial [Spirochaetales bacterium]|nr:DUF47 family protein [Spirochaetales bacterium]